MLTSILFFRQKTAYELRISDWSADVCSSDLKLDDIDLFEINEAFAVVAAKFVRDLGLSWDKVNVNGGAIALGHPIGATGSILIGTVFAELTRRGGRSGPVTDRRRVWWGTGWPVRVYLSGAASLKKKHTH